MPCPPDKPTPPRWVSTADLVADAVRLAALLPPDVGGIVGIPRSGMIPASVIATHLHLPLWELDGRGQLRQMGAGSRGGSLRRSGRLVVVDDTVYAGGAMLRARAALSGKPALFTAVYARPEASRAVDLYAVDLYAPHLLEWNIVANGPWAGMASHPSYRKGVATDLDGILCHDHASGGPVGTPYLLPRAHPCRLIVTGRHERGRGVTEEWLRRWGVRWQRLEMLPDHEDGGSAEAIARHKAAHYAASGLGYMIESDPVQAETIHRLAGLPVICPIARRVFQ